MKVSITGGAPVTIATWEGGGGSRGASWSPDGWIVLSGYNGLVRVRDDGSAPEELTLPSRERREKVHILPQILPGGEAVLFTLGTGDTDTFDDASIAVLSLATGDYRVVMEGGTKPRYVDTGHIVYARADYSLWAIPFDADRLEATGSPTPVLEGVQVDIRFGNVEFVDNRPDRFTFSDCGERTQ